MAIQPTFSLQAGGNDQETIRVGSDGEFIICRIQNLGPGDVMLVNPDTSGSEIATVKGGKCMDIIAAPQDRLALKSVGQACAGQYELIYR